MQKEIRLNKFISHNTKYSRREADQLIQDGFVKIGHKVVTNPATKVLPEDKVFIKGKFVKRKNEFTVIIYHKQKGELVSKKDDRGRKTIYDSLPKRFAHFLPVGRLDFASTGLLLLSDSPKVVDALMHSKLERVYYIKIKGEVSPSLEQAMKEGLVLKDALKGAHQKTKQKSMEFAPFLWYRIQKQLKGYTILKLAINEGKNRELRRFFAHFGNDVVDLKRVEFGGISLDIKPGKYRFLNKSEYASLHKFLKDINKVG